MESGRYVYRAEEEGSSSSSRSAHDAPPLPEADDSADELDHFVDAPNDDVPGDDPLGEALAEPRSFKRRQKQIAFSQPARLLSALTARRQGSLSPRSPRSGTATPTRLQTLNTARSDDSPRSPHRVKEGVAPDWYVEGPGRRVGYEDMTAIDWIFEYTKERQRLRVLYSSATGLMGYVQRLLDASQVWVILVLTGLAVGVIAAAIGVASDWLGDLKAGFCHAGDDGGAFYLNKNFCCMGYDQGHKCADWKPWAAALGVHSTGGKWFIEYFFFLFLSVTFAFCASMLVKEYAIYARHSGIPEIKTVLGGFIIRRFLGTWTLATKSLGLVLAVASGMWLGKEGPLVHVACCCANLFVRPFPVVNANEARKREVLSAAAASGISVAFGSPIGGVLFSLEQLSYYFPDKTMWQSFVCAMTAAVTLQALDPFRSGKLVLYQVKYTTGWHGFEILPFAVLGILGGIYGGLFIKLNMRLAEWRKTTNWPLPGPVAQVVIVALLTALVNYPNLYMRAQSTELVAQLLSDCNEVLDDQFGLCKTGAATAGTIVLLLLAAVLGFFLASITFGLQIPAGIILPSMAIGALTGRAVGIIMEIWQGNHPGFIGFQACAPDLPCITPGTYAIVGAAAALAGVTRMTVSIVVITFELTGALTHVLPIMVAVMLSKWVGDALSRRGIYESWIRLSEYPFLDAEADGTSRPSFPDDLPAGHIMTRIEDLVVLTATGHTIASLQAVLEGCDYRGFPVVNNPRDALLLGYISRAELTYNLRSATRPPRSLPPDAEAFFGTDGGGGSGAGDALDLRPWMDQTPLTMPSRSSLHLAVAYFQKLGVRYVLFTDRGALQGLLTKKDCWYVLNGAEETRRTAAADGQQQQQLARGERGGRGQDDDDDDADDAESPAIERGTML